MIKHVVMWKLKDEANGDSKQTNIDIMIEKLSGMVGKIPTLLSLETGKSCTSSPAAYDVVLITRHKDIESLDEYRNHPLHKEVAAFISEVTSDRAVVDFEE